MLVIAFIAAYAFLELISRKVVDKLGENCMAEIHLSLSAIRVNASLEASPTGKQVQIEKLPSQA